MTYNSWFIATATESDMLLEVCFINENALVVLGTKIKEEQAGAELGQAQLQLELGFTLIKVCCISLMITN